MGNGETIDITSDAFARRLANLLGDRRETTGTSLRQLARTSDRAFDVKFLRAVETGQAELDEQTVCELAALYGAELADILPTRLPLRISEPGVLSTSGIDAPFDPTSRDSLLTSYLLLVRQLRAQEREPIIDLRREDVETIAAYLQEPGPTVVERLSTLMGATQLQRRAMVGMFIAGAIVIGLAGSGVAAFTDVGSQAPVAGAVVTTAVGASDDGGEDVVAAPAVEAEGGESEAGESEAGESSETADLLPPSTRRDAGRRAASVDDLTVVTQSTPTPEATAPADSTGPATTLAPVVPTVAPSPASPGASTPGPSTATPVPTATTAPAVATAEPPVATQPAPDGTIPDLPFDPPATATPTTAATGPPQTAPATTTTVVVAEPPPPPTTEPQVAVGEPPVPTEPQVAVGEPPVP